MMPRSRQSGRLRLVAVLFVFWLLAGMAYPFLLSDDTERTARLQAAPSDVFTVSAPVALGYGVSLDRATLQVQNRIAEGSSVEQVLASGKARLIVDGGVLRFDPRQASLTVQDPAPMLQSIIGGQFESIRFRRTRVVLVLSDQRTETLSNLDGELANRRRSGLGLQGTLDLRGLSHAIDVQIGAPADRRLPLRVPLRLTAKGPLVSGTFDGRIGLGEAWSAQGQVDATVGDLRQTATSFGLEVSQASGVGGLRMRGRLEWARATLAFDKATFNLDAGEASGTLSLDAEAPRPVLTGTLAFGALDLSRALAAIAQVPEGFSWHDFARPRAYLPLARDLDVDVRVSATSVKAAGHELGNTAATLNVKQGKLNAELAEFEFAGGKGNAQITADLAQSAPRFSTRSRIVGVDAAKVSTLFWGMPLIGGAATIQADLTVDGADAAYWAHSARGPISIRVTEGGRLGVDLRGLFQAPSLPVGWEWVSRAATPLETLDAKVTLRAGVVTADSIIVQSGDSRYEAFGRLDRPEGKISGRIRYVRESRGTAAAAEDIVRIEGDALRPDISREPLPSRAAAPESPARGG